MGWRTGLHTYGAHYLTSIAKNATCIEGIVPAWDAASIGKQEVDEWLVLHAGPGHDAAVMVNKIREFGLVGGLRSEDGHDLSIAQWCDRKRWDQIKDHLSEKESLHVMAHSGPGHHWVTLPPLLHKNWNMPPLEWLTATRRRLGIDVFPVERQCGFCLWDRCDTKGNHATMCIGGASCTLRHNEVRSTLAKALGNAGFETGYEHGGGLNDGRKPGDIIAYNWKGTKHLLVDVAVVNPLAPTYRKHLIQGGPGQTAKF